ncbi:hypothetical protein HYT92_03665 [Candidatus Pacearchaeota archaeon]|nr:hypothetical protein [Candidatus Pacearchaeota archaeon]
MKLPKIFKGERLLGEQRVFLRRVAWMPTLGKEPVFKRILEALEVNLTREGRGIDPSLGLRHEVEAAQKDGKDIKIGKWYQEGWETYIKIKAHIADSIKQSGILPLIRYIYNSEKGVVQREREAETLLKEENIAELVKRRFRRLASDVSQIDDEIKREEEYVLELEKRLEAQTKILKYLKRLVEEKIEASAQIEGKKPGVKIIKPEPNAEFYIGDYIELEANVLIKPEDLITPEHEEELRRQSNGGINPDNLETLKITLKDKFEQEHALSWFVVQAKSFVKKPDAMADAAAKENIFLKKERIHTIPNLKFIPKVKEGMSMRPIPEFDPNTRTYLVCVLYNNKERRVIAKDYVEIKIKGLEIKIARPKEGAGLYIGYPVKVEAVAYGPKSDAINSEKDPDFAFYWHIQQGRKIAEIHHGRIGLSAEPIPKIFKPNKKAYLMAGVYNAAQRKFVAQYSIEVRLIAQTKKGELKINQLRTSRGQSSGQKCKRPGLKRKKKKRS